MSEVDIEKVKADLKAAGHLLAVEAITAVQHLESELTELNQLFDLRWKADMRAVKRWQEAGPGRELTHPDRADLVVFLLEELDKKQQILERLPIDTLWKCPDCGYYAKYACVCPNPECRLNHPMQSKNVIGQCRCGGAVSMKNGNQDCNRCGPNSVLKILFHRGI